MTIDTAVVLAAGEGTRLRPLTKYRPKPMLPAGNRPILECVLDALVNSGIEKIHLVVGYRRERVQTHFGPTYRGLTITYHVQKNQLGSGHALLQAREEISEPFLVVNGDEVVADKMVKAVVDAHTTERLGTLAVLESDDAPNYGAVRMQDSELIEFIEKPQQGDYRLLNAGIYAFDTAFFGIVEDTPRKEGELGLPESIRRALEGGRSIHGVRTEGMRTKATYPWNLTELSASLLDAGLVREPEIEDGIYVAKSAHIHPDSTLRAPVVIGGDAVVSPNAVVGPNVAVGRNVTIEANSTVEYSILEDDTRIGANVAFFNSISGHGADVGVGVTVPKGPSNVQIGTSVHEGERLGCVAADRAEIGGGSTVEPGALIGPEVKVAPGAFVRGNVKANSEVTR